jgi:pimeloyl-ACP methyl ester carboxylesterase
MSQSNLARKTLGANAAFSTFCGFGMVFGASTVVNTIFVSQTPWQTPLIIFLGFALVFFAANLILLATDPQLVPKHIHPVIIADIGWVVASIFILIVWGGMFSFFGKSIIIAISIIILLFAYGQHIGGKHVKEVEFHAKTPSQYLRQAGVVFTNIGFVVSVIVGGFGIFTAANQTSAPPLGDMYKIGDQSLHMVCKGIGSPTLVVDAGVSDWSLHWALIQDEVAKTTRVCSYDRAGLGWSGPIKTPLTPSSMVEDLHELLQQSGEVENLVLVGHSFGGYMARLYQNQYPENVLGLALVEASHEDQWEVMPEAVSQMAQEVVGMMKMAKAISYTGGLQYMDIPITDPLPTPEHQEILLDAMRTTQFYDSTIQHFEAVPAFVEAVRETGSLDKLPLLVISAGKSAQSYCGLQFGIDVPCTQTQVSWDELQFDLAKLSSNSQHLISPDARHYIQLDDPEFVISSLVNFALRLR